MCVWKKGKHNNRMKASSKSRLKDNAWRLTRGRSIRSAMVAFDPQLAFERPHIRCKLTLSLPSSRFLSSLHSKWILFPIQPLKGLWSLYLLIPKKDGVGPKEKAWYRLSDVNDTHHEDEGVRMKGWIQVKTGEELRSLQTGVWQSKAGRWNRGRELLKSDLYFKSKVLWSDSSDGVVILYKYQLRTVTWSFFFSSHSQLLLC